MAPSADLDTKSVSGVGVEFVVGSPRIKIDLQSPLQGYRVYGVHVHKGKTAVWRMSGWLGTVCVASAEHRDGELAITAVIHQLHRQHLGLLMEGRAYRAKRKKS